MKAKKKESGKTSGEQKPTQMRKELASWRERYAHLRREADRLRKENKELRAMIADLERRGAVRGETGRFIESHGVLWKRGFDGNIEKMVYCPKCRLVMSPFPTGYPDYIMCTQCRFKAPFHPKELDEIAKSISAAD